ncbi:MAG: NAD-dependent epimerase/dehydratase family protein [Candidatus Zixiibacteriota bacterium]
MPTDPMDEHSQRTQTQTVLVTGANGFIGSRLCMSLVAHGFNVVAGVRENADLRRLENLDVTYARGDITCPESLPEMISGMDTVIHNAGLIKARKPSRIFEVNTRGSEELYAACLRSETVRRFVFVSSLAAAGPSNGKPRSETDFPAPVTRYGLSKLKAEEALLRQSKQHSRINLQIVRPPGVYGPGDREVFKFFQTLNRGIRPLVGNVKRRLNLVYVDDLAEGISRLIEHEAPSGNIYFLAETASYSFEELIGHIGAAVGRKGIPLPVPGWALKTLGAVTQAGAGLIGATPMLTLEKAKEILHSWEVNSASARADFDFSPAISFPEGARLTVAWYRDHGWL